MSNYSAGQIGGDKDEEQSKRRSEKSDLDYNHHTRDFGGFGSHFLVVRRLPDKGTAQDGRPCKSDFSKESLNWIGYEPIILGDSKFVHF